MQGGWETDESKTEAALRETVEEAGVTGIVEVSASPYLFLSLETIADKDNIKFCY